MEKITYFDVPTQVKFIDFDGCDDNWFEEKGGIAYGNEIICGCCGGIIELDDLWSDWEELKDHFPNFDSPLKVYKTWVDISDDIRD